MTTLVDAEFTSVYERGEASTATPSSLPEPSRRRWLQRTKLQWVDLVLPSVLVLWVASVIRVNPEALTDYGLLAALPVSFFVAATLLVVSIAITVHRRPASRLRLTLHLVVLVVLLHGTVPAIFIMPNYPWVYKHIGVVNYINSRGRLNTSVDIYQNWPGFFALGAWFTKIAGVSSPLSYAAWAPVYFNLLACVELAYIARQLGIVFRTRWLALFLFIVGNWVGQDYFAPQALAFLLSLAVFGLVLTWFQADRPVVLMRTVQRIAERVVWADARRKVDTHVRAPSRPRTAEVAAVLAVFAVVVVSHQLSPYMVLAGVGTLGALGFVKPRWIVVAMAGLAGAFLALRFPYLQRTQDILGSFLHPFDNIKSNGFADNPVMQGRRLTAFGAPLLVAAMWGLGAIGVARRLRAGRPAALVAVLAASPLLLAVAMSYGGEAVFRIYLFSLPWTALLGASALERSGRGAGVNIGLVSAVLAVAVLLFMSGFFGAEELYRVRPGDVRASTFFYAHARPKSVLILGAGIFPGRIAANYDQFVSSDSTPDLLTTAVGFTRRQLGARDLPAVSKFASSYATGAPGGVYLALTTTQQQIAEVLGLAPYSALHNLDRALTTSPEWRVFYRNPDAVIYRFAPATASGVASPDPPVRTGDLATAPTGNSTDPIGLSIGIVGLTAGALILKRQHTRRSTHSQTHQEDTMSVDRVITNESRDYVLDESGPVEVAVGVLALADVTVLLHDPSATIRLDAMRRLDASAATVSLLHGLAADDLSADVRAAAVRALAHAFEAKWSDLASALADAQPVVRCAAVDALRTTDTDELEALIVAADDSDVGVRQTAQVRLATASPPVLWQAICSSAHSTELRAALRETVPDRLADLALEGLCSSLASDRVIAIGLAAEAATPDALELITAAVGDADAGVRICALAHLRGSVASARVAIGAVVDSDSAVRFEAARTLGTLDDDGALAALVGALNDAEPTVRSVAADSLVSRVSAGLAALVTAARTTLNGADVDAVLIRMGPVGQRALASHARHDAEEAAKTSVAAIMEGAHAQAAADAAGIIESVNLEATNRRAELDAEQVAVMETARRGALEEVAKIHAAAGAESATLPPGDVPAPGDPTTSGAG